MGGTEVRVLAYWIIPPPLQRMRVIKTEHQTVY